MAGSQVAEQAIPIPSPSKQSIPNWYKEVPANRADLNIKACMPFLDAMTNGYIQKTWTDILVEEGVEGFKVSFDHEVKILSWREQNDLPEMEGYRHTQFVWQRQWSPIFPANFSGLITHPLNRIDLPFYTFSGIVEFDLLSHTPVGNLPFYLKKGFTGVIPEGTPMFQIIPLSRVDWDASIRRFDANMWQDKLTDKEATPEFYRKKIWQKKTFGAVNG